MPREFWYDNLKSVVLERHGDAIRFTATVLERASVRLSRALALAFALVQVALR